MSSVKRLMAGSVTNTINLVLQIVSGFIIMPITIIALGDSTFGIWTLVAAFMGYYGLMDFGLSSAVSRFISRAIGAKSSQDIAHFTATAFYVFVFICFAAILLTAIGSNFSWYLFKNSSETEIFNNLLFIFCLNALITFPSNIFNGCLVSHYRYDVINGLKIFSTLLRLLGTVILLKQGYGVYALAFLTTACNLIENVPKVIFAYKIEKSLSVSFKNFDVEKLKELFGYSVYTFIANVADTVRFQIAPLMITIFASVGAVTHFRVGYRLIEFYSLFIVGVYGVLLPYFSQKSGEENNDRSRENLLFVTKICVLMASFIGFSMIFYGDVFIQKWMGVEYKDAYEVLVVLTIGFMLALIQNPSLSYLYGIAQHKSIAFCNVGEAIANLILSLFLIKKFGILGAALSITLPMVITKLFVQPVFVSYFLKIKYSDYLLKTLLLPLLLSGCIFSMIGLVIYSRLTPSYLVLALYYIAHITLFIIIGYFLLLNDYDRKRILNMGQKFLFKKDM